MDLKDKIVVITGASKGLGKEISILLAKERCKLALIARSEKELAELTSGLKKSGTNCEYFVCDVADGKQVSESIQKILEKFERIDILINNAGIWAEGKFEEHSLDQIKKLFEVNTLGTINSCFLVVPQMKKQKSGQILNVISVAGIETPGDMGPFSPYTSSKYAITGFTKSLEEELQGTGIKVQAIYPGGMNTEIYRAAGYTYSDNEDWMMDKKDVAQTVVFMLKQPEDVIIDELVVRKFNK